MTVAIIEQTNIKLRANQALQNARELVISTQDGYIQACEARKALKAIEKDILDTHNPVVEHWHAKHKQAVADKNADLQPVQEAGKIVGTKMADWETAQEKIRLAEEARIRELARQQEHDRAMAEAQAAEAEGDTEAAEAIIQEAIAAPPPVVFVPKAAPVAGISYTEKWDFEVVDESKIPREFLVRDDVKIRRVVTAMKAQTNIPGIRAYSKKIQNTRI